MSIAGRPPASRILGVCRGPDAAAALVVEGALVGWGRGSDQGAVAEALVRADTVGSTVEQVAFSADPGPLRRVRCARAARLLVGKRAAFVGQGVVGRGLPRRSDRRDRVTLHPPAACLAASAYFTAGARVLLVLVVDQGGLSPWLGTSGKLVSLGAAEAPAGADSVSRWLEKSGAPSARWVGVDRPENAQPGPVEGTLAQAVGAAWLGWAEERQGAWVPPVWSLRGRRGRR